MGTEPEIATRVAAFKSARATERAHLEASKDADLDVRIAERIGDEAATAEAKSRKDRAAMSWYDAWKEMKAEAVALCEALGVNPDDLKDGLQ